MPRIKKNKSLLHPIDAVMHWYSEAQNVPAQLKKKFEQEKKQAVQLIQELKLKLQKAKKIRIEARAMKVAAAQKVKEKSTKTAQALLKKREASYQRALLSVEKLTQEIAAAKVQLGHTKIKEKYLRALEGAFTKVTKLFTKKHRKALDKTPPLRSRKAKVKSSPKTAKNLSSHSL